MCVLILALQQPAEWPASAAQRLLPACSDLIRGKLVVSGTKHGGWPINLTANIIEICLIGGKASLTTNHYLHMNFACVYSGQMNHPMASPH